MDPRFQTSFIPKKPITATSSVWEKTVNIFSLVATVLFIVSVAFSGGVFFYEKLVADQIKTNEVNLNKSKSHFDPNLIENVKRLDTRIETSKKLLSSHVSVTPFFGFLSSVTLKSVRFKDISFSYLSGDKVVVLMKGQAQSYEAVALQSDLLEEQSNLNDTVISDMALEAAGTVSFNVTTTVNSNLLSYSKNVLGQTASSSPKQ